MMKAVIAIYFGRIVVAVGILAGSAFSASMQAVSGGGQAPPTTTMPPVEEVRQMIEGLPPATIATTTTTTTIVLPNSIPRNKELRCPQWEWLFAEYGLPVEVFSYIAYRESRCNPKSVNAEWDENGNMTYHLNKNKSWDTGLLQVNSSWISAVREVCGRISSPPDKRADLEILKDPHCNVKFAKWLMDNTSGKLSNWSIAQ
jgi:hypothetical protein